MPGYANAKGQRDNDMSTWFGIDEAGYGPTLGPLSVMMCWCELPTGYSDPGQLFVDHRIKVGDSKAIHHKDHPERLESVALSALAWIFGSAPRTASEAFALVGEQAPDRAPYPWMEGAEAFTLPLSEKTVIEAWPLPTPRQGLSGHLIHPQTYNDTLARGHNKAAMLLQRVASLIGTAGQVDDFHIICDRLGGRRYYTDALRQIWPGADVDVVSEGKGVSRYDVVVDGHRGEVGFLVGADGRNPLVASASCIAKYLRELHMILFNRWWSEKVPGLKPTAGYPQDASRWLGDIGGEWVQEFGPQLIRGHTS